MSDSSRTGEAIPSGDELVALVTRRPLARILRWYVDRIEAGHVVAWDDVAEGVHLPNGHVVTWPLEDPAYPITRHMSIEDASEYLDAFPAAVTPEIFVRREPAESDAGSLPTAPGGGEQAG